MKKLQKIIGKKKLAIAAVHLQPTEGFLGYPGFDQLVEALLEDLKTVQEAGFDSLIIENNYDLPHQIYLAESTVHFLEKVLTIVRKEIRIPFGFSILWNDYRTALSLAKQFGAAFVRVPVFVDTVLTDFGMVEPVAKAATQYRSQFGCTDVEIFADIHVKHAQLISKNSITESAIHAITQGADAVIITGKWTADAPKLTDLEQVKNAVAKFPVIIGSGATPENIHQMMKNADAVIVGTCLKEGKLDDNERNRKPYNARINARLARKFMSEFRP